MHGFSFICKSYKTRPTCYLLLHNHVAFVLLPPVFNAVGIPSSFEHRKEIARANGIEEYTGTAEQNTELVVLLAKGELRKE